MANHVVIMAGGIGSRFWPLSTPEFPKQFIDILGCGRSLIQLLGSDQPGLCGYRKGAASGHSRKAYPG